jgi:hypothetical protein
MFKGMRIRFGTCAAGGILAAIAVTSGTAYMVPAASAATMDGNPSSTAQATVTVAQSISFAFNGPTSFTLAPGVTDNNAVSFTVSTNDSHGYSLSLAAPDLTAGGATIPATDLSYTTFSGGSEVDQGAATLTNAAGVFYSATLATGGTGFNQNWLATVPANQAPGAYQTTLTYVAVGA